MRDKFTELIDKGVARFEYKNLYKESPETSPICKLYNTFYGPVLNTHMSEVDGELVITGHYINTQDWDKFLYSPNWGGVNLKASGFYSLIDFLQSNNLTPEKTTLNGDVVCVLKPMRDIPFQKQWVRFPTTYTTMESQIPQNIKQLTTNFQIEEISKCFESENVIKALNESPYVRGRWYYVNEDIVGVIDNKIVKINL